MSEDEECPVTISRDAGRVYRPGSEAAPGLAGPQVREDVNAGADVIDLTAMIREFESNPNARRRPGDR